MPLNAENAKSVKESMDAVHAFCGLMAGFEGFIINEYVNSNGNAAEHPFDAEGESMYEDPFADTFQWGLFLLTLSFSLNLAAATASFLWGGARRGGRSARARAAGKPAGLRDRVRAGAEPARGITSERAVTEYARTN